MAKSDDDLSAYDFPLDEERIAQHPPKIRGRSRLLILDRAKPGFVEHPFSALPQSLRPDDLLVLNDVRVRCARLCGVRDTGGKVNVLLVERRPGGRWRAMVRSRRAPREGEQLVLEEGALSMTVVGRDLEHGGWLLDGPESWDDVEPHARAALPPYIKRTVEDYYRDRDREYYRTVYAGDEGEAVAAPTAGLHFTPELLSRLKVEIARVRLDVGEGTFLPVKQEKVADHPMHSERYVVDADAAAALTRAVEAGRRIVAVGTTAARVIETLAREQQPPYQAVEGETRLFLRPPDTMKITGALLTNFHLPKSTLLMLVSAMAGRQRILDAYRWAADERFRFHSYGDAMLIV